MKNVKLSRLQIKNNQTWNFVTAISNEDASMSIYPCRALLGEDVSIREMESLYNKMKSSGMFWELYPEMTGNWHDDEAKLFRWVECNS